LDESQRTLSGQVSPNRLGRKHGKTSGLVKISSKNRVIWARKNDYARWNWESYVNMENLLAELSHNELKLRRRHWRIRTYFADQSPVGGAPDRP